MHAFESFLVNNQEKGIVHWICDIIWTDSCGIRSNTGVIQLYQHKHKLQFMLLIYIFQSFSKLKLAHWQVYRPCIWLWWEFWKPFPIGGGGGSPPTGLSGGRGGLPPGPPRGGSGPGRPMGRAAWVALRLPPPMLRPEGGGGGRGPLEKEYILFIKHKGTIFYNISYL